MDSELTPRQKAEGVMTRWKSGLGVGEPGLTDAITTAIQKQSNEDLERHRAKRAALEAELAAANERCAELAAGLDRLRKNALEMAGYVKSYGMDDVGPQSEWSRYSQCRSNIENVADCATILAAVREKARLAGVVGALKDLLLWREIEGSTSDLLWFTELKIRIAALEAKG